MKIGLGEFGMVVRGESGNEFDDSSSDQGISMIFVLQYLIADVVVSLMHELPKPLYQ